MIARFFAVFSGLQNFEKRQRRLIMTPRVDREVDYPEYRNNPINPKVGCMRNMESPTTRSAFGSDATRFGFDPLFEEPGVGVHRGQANTGLYDVTALP